MNNNQNTLNTAYDKMNPNVNPMFHRRDFEDKETVLILAKTWGAARLFFFQTALSKFRNLKVEYLSKKEQIKIGMHHKNTVLIVLPRAFENKKNGTLLKLCGSRKFKIINFKTTEA